MPRRKRSNPGACRSTNFFPTNCNNNDCANDPDNYDSRDIGNDTDDTDYRTRDDNHDYNHNNDNDRCNDHHDSDSGAKAIAVHHRHHGVAAIAD